MAGLPDPNVFRVSDLLVYCDKENKEVHIKDVNDPYYGATIDSENELKELILVLARSLKIFRK